jgi:hypothetical protein
MDITGEKLLAIAKAAKPNVKYTMNVLGNAIGAYDEQLGRFVTVVFKANPYWNWDRSENEVWLPLTGELIINGKVAIQEDWREE